MPPRVAGVTGKDIEGGACMHARGSRYQKILLSRPRVPEGSLFRAQPAVAGFSQTHEFAGRGRKPVSQISDPTYTTMSPRLRLSKEDPVLQDAPPHTHTYTHPPPTPSR